MLPRSLHLMMQRLGFDVLPYDADRFPELRRPTLLRERQITLVLDVGANDGSWAERVRRSGYTGRLVSFEPLAAAYRELESRGRLDQGWETSPVALGDTTGTATFHVAGNSSSSSLLPMTGRHIASAPESAYVATEEVKVRRLDDVASDRIRPGERVLVGLRPEDLTLTPPATGGPTSAQNRLSGRIVRVTPLGPLWRVGVDCGVRLTALVTRPAVQTLALAPGVPVEVTFKATAVHLVRRGASAPF